MLTVALDKVGYEGRPPPKREAKASRVLIWDVVSGNIDSFLMGVSTRVAKRLSAGRDDSVLD